MNRRLPVAAAAAGGGLLAAAFLSAGVAAAATVGDAAFIAPDGFTFDPVGGEYNDVGQFFGVAPLYMIGGGPLGATQDFDVSKGAEELGTVTSSVNVSNILGIETAQFTIHGGSGDVSAEDIAAALTTAGYTDADFTGGDLDGVAAALAGSGIDLNTITGEQVQDVLANSDIYSATGPLDFDALAVALNSADLAAGADGDAIAGALGEAGYTEDNFTGDDSSLTDVGNALSGLNFSTGDVTGAEIEGALNSAGIFGGDVNLVDPGALAADLNAADLGDGAALPDGLEDGTVYSITNFGLGFYNFYEAVPTGDGHADITDVLVTPFGFNLDLSTPFNAIADFMPGSIAGGVDASPNDFFGDLFGGGSGGDFDFGDLFGGGDASDGAFDLFDPSSWF